MKTGFSYGSAMRGLLVMLAGASISLDSRAAEPSHALAVSDLDEIRNVWGPQISPDGSWVAYTITEVDTAADVAQSDIWLTRWDGKQTVQLTSSPASEHSPLWSPDGRRIAFLSTGADAAAGDQLWLIDMDGEHLEQVTRLELGVTDFDWAPDSRRLALVSDVAAEGYSEEAGGGPVVVDRMLFKRDGYGYLAKVRSRVHLLDLDDGSIVQLTNGPHDEIMPSISPDGRRIAYVTKQGDDPDKHENWDILTIEPGAAKPGRISNSEFMECDPVWGWSLGGPSWSPDSREITCIQSGPLEYSWFTLHQVAIFSADGDSGRQPTATLDRNTTEPRFSADGKRVYFLLEDDQSVQLASVHTDGSDLRRLTPSSRTVANYDLGPNGKIAVLTSAPDTPPEIAVLDDGELRQLTFANRALLESRRMMSAETVAWQADDGTELHGLIMKPPGFREGVRYPTVFRLHGGPVAQWQHEFDFSWQLLAAQGYVVFGPNPRGSSGRGEAFQKTIFGDWGNADVRDVLAAADHLVAAGIADKDRLGIGGWSAGAMLTNYTIASDTRFRAATSGAGVSNMLAGFGTDEWWQDWEAELGLPWETPENWVRVSYPFLHADRIKTPTLFLGGSEDFNVPIIHSEQMYMALKRLGVPTRLVVYPGETHGISRPSFRRDVLERYLAWYDQWLN